ncbi:MAG: cysteine desulfurase [Polyangiaceae bacterium]
MTTRERTSSEPSPKGSGSSGSALDPADVIRAISELWRESVPLAPEVKGLTLPSSATAGRNEAATLTDVVLSEGLGFVPNLSSAPEDFGLREQARKPADSVPYYVTLGPTMPQGSGVGTDGVGTDGVGTDGVVRASTMASNGPRVHIPSAPWETTLTPQIRAFETSGLGRPMSLPSVRSDFPILAERVDGRPLVWLDNAATTQKPRAVIERLKEYYSHENSNIHRAAHALAARATDAYEKARGTVARFINAGSPENVVFVRGATEAINLVAQTWGRKYIQEGDEILISWLEHHSNIVPWQHLAKERGARLVVAPVDDHGQVILREYERLLGPKTKLVSITQVSNALGTVLPVAEMTALAHRYGARVLVDGAQSISHMPVDVRALGADFFAISGHKVFGPTGIGVLYGRPDVLESMPPWQAGGNMIADVTFERTSYMPPPSRFEAGTGNIADAIGLGAALEYLEGLGMAKVAAFERELMTYATEQLLRIPGLKIIGTAAEKAGVISFVLANRSVADVGSALSSAGIAVRAGHHCAQPALRRFGLEATVRPSFALYNDCDDIDALVSVVSDVARSAAH